jgi:hypothetical protein
MEFRGSITQRLISLRFVGAVTRPLRKTRFRLLVRLCRTGLIIRTVSMKGFTFEMILVSRASWRKVRLFRFKNRSKYCVHGIGRQATT